VKATIKSVSERAAAGEPGAAELLAQWLADFPEYKAGISAFDELAAKAEAAWVKVIAGGNHLTEQAARDEVATLRAELLPPNASFIDRILVGAVVVAHLTNSHATMMAAMDNTNPPIQMMRERRLAITQKRLFTAWKGLQTIAKKKARGLRPTLKLLDVTPATPLKVIGCNQPTKHRVHQPKTS
jgi:hypothetical protein